MRSMHGARDVPARSGTECNRGLQTLGGGIHNRLAAGRDVPRSVHWHLPHSSNGHCDHELWSSPSPPPEKRAAERRPMFHCAHSVHGKVCFAFAHALGP